MDRRYVAGAAAGSDGGDLIREAGRGIIAVTIEYRLGVFGFLAGSVVKERGALNAGLRKYNRLLSERVRPNLDVEKLINALHSYGFNNMYVDQLWKFCTK